MWKFFCGLHAKYLAEQSALSNDEIYTKSFRCIINDNVSTRLACLNMIHCAFESQHLASCSDLLNLVGGTIDVNEIALNPSDCSALGYVLAQAHEEIKKIDFSYCHLGPDGIAAFVQQLESLKGTLPNVDMLRYHYCSIRETISYHKSAQIKSQN